MTKAFWNRSTFDKVAGKSLYVFIYPEKICTNKQ